METGTSYLLMAHLLSSRRYILFLFQCIACCNSGCSSPVAEQTLHN